MEINFARSKFCSSEDVDIIRPIAKPIRLHCNKGRLDTKLKADFGDTPVYFDSRGIVNVLLLYQLGQKFHITYDSKDCGGIFKVNTKVGVMEFAPTSRSLHALNFCDNPDATFILVNDTDVQYSPSPVQTVWK
jgi:hypothetical protein